MGAAVTRYMAGRERRELEPPKAPTIE
jgi:hypothetical protein